MVRYLLGRFQTAAVLHVSSDACGSKRVASNFRRANSGCSRAPANHGMYVLLVVWLIGEGGSALAGRRSKQIAPVVALQSGLGEVLFQVNIEPVMAGNVMQLAALLNALTYKSNTVVEYSITAQTDGLGTRPSLKKNDSPIEGVAMLVERTPDAIQLAVRLPPDLSGLASAVIHQVEPSQLPGSVGACIAGSIRDVVAWC